MVLFLVCASSLLVGSFFAYRIFFKEGRLFEQGFRMFQIFLGLLVILCHGWLMFGLLNAVVFLAIAAATGSLAETAGVTRG